MVLPRHSPPAPQGPQQEPGPCAPAPAVTLTLLVAFLLPLAALAADVEVGQRIELKADKPAGVPLHNTPRPSMIGRAPDRSAATVIGLEGGARWLNIDLDDGRTAWIVDRYIGRVLPGDGQRRTATRLPRTSSPCGPRARAASR